MLPSFRLLWVLLIYRILSPAVAFSFSHNDPTQCDDITVSWSGGTGPFNLLLIPDFGTPRTVPIPPSAFSDGRGSFSTPLPFAQDQDILLSMSDATGFGAGGSTPVLTVGASQGGSCNTTDPGVDFSFELNSALQQCRAFVFSAFTGAIRPVTIYGIVPGGTSFILNPPAQGTQFSWIANVAKETSLIFIMTDSQGRQGGSSDVRIVSASDDDTCLNDSSPSSTPAAPTSTSESSSPSSASTSPTSSPTSPIPGPDSSSNVSIGAIAGTVIGALLFLAVVITLGLFCLRRRLDRRAGSGYNGRGRLHSEVDLTYDPGNNSSRMYPYPESTTSLPSAAATSPPFLLAGQQDPNPFSDTHSQMTRSDIAPLPHHYQHSHAPSYPPTLSQFSYNARSQSDPTSPHSTAYPPSEAGGPSDRVSSRDSMSTSRKGALAGASTYRPTRFIVHTDEEDILPPPNEDGVVELPPQYSERRALAATDAPEPTNSQGPINSQRESSSSHLPYA